MLRFVDNLKITDFGLATVFRHQGKERSLCRCCGTPPYVAPEVFYHVYLCNERLYRKLNVFSYLRGPKCAYQYLWGPKCVFSYLWGSKCVFQTSLWGLKCVYSYLKMLTYVPSDIKTHILVPTSMNTHSLFPRRIFILVLQSTRPCTYDVILPKLFSTQHGTRGVL